jgi:hypothetical protein
MAITKIYPRRLLLALAALFTPLILATSLQAGISYHENVNSRKFHAPGCRYYDCSNCKAVFNSREAAIKAGFVPCKVCRP